ncbi:MAG: hypothetical protein ABJN69_07655 [Hellea sp.]
MTNKPNRWGFIFLAILVALILGFCQSKDFRQKICNGVCDTASEPEIFRLVSRTYINGKLENTSGSKLYVTSTDGDLVEPSDVTWERAPGSDVFVEKKRQGLDKACFADSDYTVSSLDGVELNASDVTITVLNFDDEGRVESYDLEKTGGGYPDGLNALFAPNKDYADIQAYLSGLTRAQVTPDGTGITRVTPKGLTNLTNENTPFDETLSAASDDKGKVVFYVLADAKLTFSRGPFAMISYAPEADEAIGELYSPYVVYPVIPIDPGNNLDVLVIHFKRGGSMSQDENSQCRYPYDLAVVAEGQNGFSPRTPLLIDPEVLTNGSFP